MMVETQMSIQDPKLDTSGYVCAYKPSLYLPMYLSALSWDECHKKRSLSRRASSERARKYLTNLGMDVIVSVIRANPKFHWKSGGLLVEMKISHKFPVEASFSRVLSPLIPQVEKFCAKGPRSWPTVHQNGWIFAGCQRITKEADSFSTEDSMDADFEPTFNARPTLQFDYARSADVVCDSRSDSEQRAFDADPSSPPRSRRDSSSYSGFRPPTTPIATNSR